MQLAIVKRFGPQLGLYLLITLKPLQKLFLLRRKKTFLKIMNWLISLVIILAVSTKATTPRIEITLKCLFQNLYNRMPIIPV